MKPQMLKMQAFGCYQKETQVDFSRLGNKIFLITGATGGGKTTLLDAICFALYCRATGGKRSWSDMRSIGAPEKQETFVDFSFCLGEKRYRFRRSMRMHRVRGSDRLEQREEHACWQWEDGDWSLLLSGAESKVRERAQELLGLTCEQFSQVVVLPQGEFRKLLLSNSTEKARIFQTLFQTERWERIARTAQKLAEEQKKELDRIFGNRALLLQREEAENLEQLEEKKQHMQTELEQVKQQCLQLERQVKKANEEHAAAALLEEQFLRREAITAEIASLESRREELARRAARLEEAKRCNRLQPYETTVQQEKQEQILKEKRLREAQAQRQEAEKEHSDAEKEAQELPSLRERREQVSKQAVLLEEAEKGVKKLAEWEQKIAVLQQKSVAVEQKQKDCLAARQKAQESVKIGEQFVQNLTTQQQGVAECAARLAVLKEMDQHYTQLQERQEKSQKAENAYQQAFVQSQKAEVKLAALRTQLESITAAMQQDLSASLAEGLKEGQPCPVCGSIHHPSLAARPQGIPEEKQVEYLKEEVGRQEQEAKQLAGKLAVAEALRTAESQGYEEQRRICERLGQNSHEVQRELAEKEKALQAAQAAQEKLPRAQALLEKRKREEIQAGEEEERCAQERQELRRQMAQEEAGRSAMLETLPPDCLTQKQLEEKQHLIRQSLDTLHDQIQRVENRVLQAQRILASLQEKEQAAQDSLLESNHRLEEAQRRFEAQCRLLRVSPTEPLREKYLSQEQMERMEQEQKAYSERMHALQSQEAELNGKLQEKQRPKLLTLEQKLSQLRTQSSDASKQSGALQSAFDEIEKTLAQLQKLRVQGAELEQEYSRTARIAQLLSGGNTQKVPIRMFVLGMMLGDILCRANLYFAAFSGGRYRLSRPENTGGGRGYSGLELVVEDGYSGGSRAVETLSGGELFLASLSLAFGLSDVVQAYSGGVRLDSIFIDEGFGSLDQETLDTAMKALGAIQRTGRTVGIISHVQELKARIPNKIEVMPQRDGQSSIAVIA